MIVLPLSKKALKFHFPPSSSTADARGAKAAVDISPDP
jgi:hypothetical protein